MAALLFPQVFWPGKSASVRQLEVQACRPGAAVRGPGDTEAGVRQHMCQPYPIAKRSCLKGAIKTSARSCRCMHFAMTAAACSRRAAAEFVKYV